MSAFGKQVRNWRAENKLTAFTAADLAGVDENTWRRIEKGYPCYTWTKKRVVDAMNYYDEDPLIRVEGRYYFLVTEIKRKHKIRLEILKSTIGFTIGESWLFWNHCKITPKMRVKLDRFLVKFGYGSKK